MHIRVGTVGWWLCLATFASAQFDGDSRLERRVTLRFEANPVREVLSEVRKQTGVELSVAQDISEDLIVLLWRDKPASHLLKLIAEHFSWTWEKRDGGYRLVRTREQRDNEEAAFREQLLSKYRRTQQELRERLKRIRAADSARSRSAFEIMSRALRASRIEDETAYAAQADQLDKLEDEWCGWAEIAYDAFCNLDAKALLELEECGYYVVSTRPRKYQHAFTPDPDLVSAGIAYARFDFERLIRRSMLLDRPKDLERWSELLRNLDSLHGISIRFEAHQGDPSLSHFEVWCDFGGLWHPVFWRAFDDGRSGVLPSRAPGPRPRTRLHEIEVHAGVVDEIYYDRGSRIIWADEPRDSGSDPYVWRYGRILLKVLERTELDLLSDAYDLTSNCGAIIFDSQTITVGDALDRVAESARSVWSELNGIVAIRAKNWQLERATSLPRSVCNFVEQQMKRGGLSIDQLAQVINSLTTVQLTHNDINMVELAAGLRQMSSPREIVSAMRLYSHLSAPSREALKRGEPIPYLSLNPIGRTLFDRAFLSCSLGLYYGTPSEIAALFTLRNLEDLTRGEQTQQFNDLLSEEASLSLHVSSQLALAYEWPHGKMGLLMPDMFSTTILDKAIWESDLNMKACALNHFAFVLALRPGLSSGSTVSLTFVDPSTPFGPRANLPRPLLDELEKAASRSRGGGG